MLAVHVMDKYTLPHTLAALWRCLQLRTDLQNGVDFCQGHTKMKQNHVITMRVCLCEYTRCPN